MTPSSPSASVSNSSLLSANPAVDALEYDLLQRYAAAARILDRMLATRTGAVEVLELGPNFLNPLPLFIDPARVRLTRGDVSPVSTDADFVRYRQMADFRLPITRSMRSSPSKSSSTCRRSAPRLPRRMLRSPAMVPSFVPERRRRGEEAERRANDAYRARHGSDHPWLAEHDSSASRGGCRRHPSGADSRTSSSTTHPWKPGCRCCSRENLSERQAPAELRRLNEVAGTPTGMAYRKIYVLAKSFDATNALEPAPSTEAAAAGLPGEPLSRMAAMSAQALAALELERRNERVAEAAARRLLEIELDELRGGVTELETRLREREGCIAQLGDEIAQRAEELRTSLRRHYLVHAYAQALRQSRLQRAAEPLAKAARLVRSRGFDETALIPWNQLERDEYAGTGTWRVTGPCAYFIVPCALPAGWVQVHLHLASDQVGRAEIVFDTGDGHDEAVLVDRVAVHGRADRDGCIFLPRPVIGLRLYPLDVVGKFQLEAFRVTALSSLATLRYAFQRKYDLLTSHGLLKKSLLNALSMLSRGRFRELGSRLYGGLTYRRPAPEAIGAPEARAVEPVEEAQGPRLLAPAGTPLTWRVRSSTSFTYSGLRPGSAAA